MARLRVWLRDHVLNFLRDPHPEKRSSFRRSIMISAPVPLGSLAIDLTSDPLPTTSPSVQDGTDPHSPRQSRPMGADHINPQSIPTTIMEHEQPLDLPPTYLPEISEVSEEPEAIQHAESPARRPTRNFSRRFSSRFSAFSGHSVSSYGSSNEARRMSQMSAASSTMSKPDALGDEWVGNKLSRRWSDRMGGALEMYGMHTRNFTPLAIA
ncbi:uncharacterized protein K460DRAFT_419059 [Cucurbitaria berberidis CBS 394.84]|uniref:Uncharacterized protein n=1 Tax=Cucurbitaria berberidis CBS 394.84 TaxID=1168544 RepID=A0A9P4L6M1_9PLEO|nr:uncharacterized protein K460DRAFT_419059 [Cucurbitaria berberidis CBS 394.84]KAF1844101.1 hypothetical protein K460DRAFT_419059 [Cucurbitaria berberidis CBS 394.84]